MLIGCVRSATASLLSGLGFNAEGSEKNFVWSRWYAEYIFVKEARLGTRQINAAPDDATAAPAIALIFALAGADTLPEYRVKIWEIFAKNLANFSLNETSKDLGVMFIFAVAIRVLVLLLLWRQKRKEGQLV